MKVAELRFNTLISLDPDDGGGYTRRDEDLHLPGTFVAFCSSQ